MKKLVIEGLQGNSQILSGESILSIGKYIPERNVFIITDKNVNHYHKKKFPQFPVYVMEPGEKSKDFHAVADIYEWLLKQGADRNSFLLGIGGGVVCDITGFIAATYMRGVQTGFVATSLLAQVDASVGGKNGVNLSGYKNIVGTFSQPSFVICDTSLMGTLPDEEFANGMAEIIKHACIRDAEKFLKIEQDKYLIMSKDKSVVDDLVDKSVKIKAQVVQADEREKGERRLLNFGHTWGHAIEKVTGLSHGKSVSIGMVFAANFSVHKGFLQPTERERIIKLLQDYNLPVVTKVDNKKVFDALLHDKKREQSSIHFVFLRKIGDAFWQETSIDDLKRFVEA